ncbi:TetR/AcrR family transcriptional regulator [Gordonia neofelifaecis]|uniref:TetR family transcriptional regulator n=1 Tax=Gordonia neofelifaecis NRRL B-59395 TaxID=644548 RepID=F1YPH4_9ACTN|nr:TetR family transcriptional regulator [Gordonia neofelifaecis]EGD53425.1 TetR family transcriptional regulator [Gordonia neofelifaecis NRRL B-59395]
MFRTSLPTMARDDGDTMTGATPNRLGEATRRKLIRTAEKLFAAEGVDAVSLRAINTAAGQGAAAVHYHFGTKDDLLTAVLLDIGRQVSGEITERVAVIAADARRPELEDVVRALAEPYLALLQRERIRGMRWIKIVVQVSWDRRPAVRATGQDEVAALLREQVARALPGVSEDRIARRWPIAVASFLQSLTGLDDSVPGRGRLSDDDLDEFFDDLIAFISGGAERMLR